MFLKRQFSTILTMNRFTPKQRAEIVTLYIENSRSVVLTQRAYRRKYRDQEPPSDNSIRRLVSNFVEHGTVGDRRHAVHQRPRRSNELVDAVRESVAENPHVSYRHRAQHFGVSGTTMRRILKDDLHLFPYKVQLTQRILPTDRPRRLEYGQTVARMVDAEPDFWKQILMTDEAHFTLSGAVNKQNCRIWGTENPHEIHETPLHDQKVTAWAGVCAKTIIGPFFFREGETVDGNRYRWMLAHYVCPQMCEKGLDGYWFQQDGAPCHTANQTMQFLQRKFPGRVVSKNGDIDWPPRSPDLTPPDFFLWGYLKSKVYASKPQTIDELKANIRAEIIAIPPEMLEKVMENAAKRAHFALANKGGHLIDVVFKN